jgi:hypothetical protein
VFPPARATGLIINKTYVSHRYRERKERTPSRFELFFDLAFVAIAHQLSDGAAEQASAIGVAQFVLVCDLSFYTLVFYINWLHRHSCESFSCKLESQEHLPAVSAAQHGHCGASECTLNHFTSTNSICQVSRLCQHLRDR